MNTLQDILIRTAAKAQVLEQKQREGFISEQEKKSLTVKMILTHWEALQQIELERMREAEVI